MSFVNKIKGWGQKGAAPEHDVLEHDAAFADAYAQAGGSAALPQADLPLPDVDSRPRGVRCRRPRMPEARADTSIISEAAPSEIADFTETRLQGADTGAAPLGAGLPLIGRRPVAEQQRILIGLLGLGLIGLIVVAIYSFVSAGRGSAQVGATGQALMQSQRLAKSVSQALVGSAAAFPEVKESADVLASNVRSLKTGEGDIAAAPSGVQDALEPVHAAGRPRREERRHRARPAEGPDPGRPGAARDQPPVVRPARNGRDGLVAEAAAGRLAGRAVGGRPARDADAAHRQVGQRVPDDGRREPRGGVPARQGLELVPRDRAGPDRWQRRAAPARHQGPADARAPGCADEAIRRDAHAGRRDSRQPAGPDRGARGAGVDHCRQRAAAQRPRGRAGAARQARPVSAA